MQGEHPAKSHRPADTSDGGFCRTMARRRRGADCLISFPVAAKPQDGRNGGGQVAPDRGQGGDFRLRKYYPVLDGRQARAEHRRTRHPISAGEV